MLLTQNQRCLINVIDKFIASDIPNLFIEPPNRKFSGLNYSLIAFMVLFKNDNSHFKQLVYVVDFNMQAKDAYETFCKISEANGRNFAMKGGKDGCYKVQFSYDGIIYKFIAGSRALRGMGATTLTIFNLQQYDAGISIYEPRPIGFKSIWIIRGDKVSDSIWRAEQMEIAESYFCIFK